MNEEEYNFFLSITELTREIIFWGYHLMLGREPENEEIIQDHIREDISITIFRKKIILSNEFRDRYKKIIRCHQESQKDVIFPELDERMAVEGIIWSYKLILGKNPESKKIVEQDLLSHKSGFSIIDLGIKYLSSPEFKSQYNQLISAKSNDLNMNSSLQTFNKSLVLNQIKHWIFSEKKSYKEMLSQFQKLNNGNNGWFIFKIKNSCVSIFDKPSAKIDTTLFKRAQIYKNFFQSITPILPENLNVIFALQLHDLTENKLDVPAFSFQKPINSNSLLLPDIDFLNCDFYHQEIDLDLTPYISKSDSAIFIGSTTGVTISKEKIQNNLVPRIKSALFFQDKKDVVFNLTNIVQCDSEETVQLLKKLGFGSGRLNWHEQINHKFLISIDGNGATCSRLIRILMSNSVLLKYQSEHMLYYFPNFIPWLHYIPIEKDEQVLDIIKKEQEHPGYFANIAENGYNFCKKYLTKKSASIYTANLLIEYANLFLDSPSEDLLKNFDLSLSYGDGIKPAAHERYIRLTGHIQGIGDMDANENNLIGIVDSGKNIEGLKIETVFLLDNYGLEYRVGYPNGEKSPWSKSGQYTGTKNLNKPIISFELRANANFNIMFDCSYEATFSNKSRSGPVKIGNICQSEKLNPLETLSIKILSKSAN
ncbi:MAG: glycosyl transferase family 90 [Chthoniobacterales bacterium]